MTDTLRVALLCQGYSTSTGTYLGVDLIFPDVLVPLHYYQVDRSLQVLAISFRCQMFKQGTSGSGYDFE
jgi:hypothetical protein